MSRAVLITGATGKQGGAVVQALVASSQNDFLLLCVTRDSQSNRAQGLREKSPRIRIVQGDLNDVSGLFSAARQVAGPVPIWGVFSVQAIMGKDVTPKQEVEQGVTLIEESIRAGVSFFVYSSVERGGVQRSWQNPTTIPHFRNKHQIEQHLRDSISRTNGLMGWTILRPVAFMDTYEPNLFGKVLMTMVRDNLTERPMQWVAVSDIGVFAAKAFENPEAWNHKAIGLAGDQATFDQIDAAFHKVTGRRMETTFGLFGKALRYGVPEVRKMMNWMQEEGYKADINTLREVHPELKDWEAFFRARYI
ncbi:NAD(P)-binding protein [Aspergillus uvarum CBS 121591]|uniref:NAD(P)-binding protein n=1 Tax=Aspergillus uvarum CBS 121591 TaxID=1448315 RepID=A0A319BQG6_9EURO|nr:NAD(P)-binding protein [Aspergillus uvarum CBS 121591]PYH75696.1 NAD(P)-binding protein [Aspergillus uvarum CBS 121591]